MSTYKLINGDCIEEMKKMDANSIDSIVTDPPYEIGFMGKKWDNTGIAYNKKMWAEALRVLKPGGHMLAFSSTRTYHRMVCAIEDSGFEIRDQLAWIYGSGFPKSQDVGKMIDKKAGAKRKVVAPSPNRRLSHAKGNGIVKKQTSPNSETYCITEPSTEDAKKYDGWGTALKPAQEPIVLARKPLSEKTVAANVIKHTTGAINIDGCRVATETDEDLSRKPTPAKGWKNSSKLNGSMNDDWKKGRWPANIIHDGSEEVLHLFPNNVKGGTWATTKGMRAFNNDGKDTEATITGTDKSVGSAARFFYCAKANKQDKNSGIDKCVTSTYITGLCKEENMELVALLQKDIFVSMVKWNIDEYGKAITATCQKECLSTILTKINKTTILQICDSLMQSLTKEYTQNANCEMDNGISLVKNADNTNILSKTTTKEKMVYLPDVKSVVSKMLSKISKKESWQESKNSHTTVKPTALMMYLIKLVTPINGTVLDPFNGSGSTGKAAMLCKTYNYIGIDLSPEYITISKARIEDASIDKDTIDNDIKQTDNENMFFIE